MSLMPRDTLLRPCLPVTPLVVTGQPDTDQQVNSAPRNPDRSKTMPIPPASAALLQTSCTDS